MDDEELRELIGEYDASALNLAYLDVFVEWIEDDDRFGSRHMESHGVTKDEVEQVIFQVPPEVEAKKCPDDPRKTWFWGATNENRWLFIACGDRVENGRRILTPITAFEPDMGDAYWRAL